MAERSRAEIEQAIRAKRRERDLYVSPEGVKGIHAQLDALLTEWEACDDRADQRPATAGA